MASFDDSTIPEDLRPDTCPLCGGERICILFGMLSAQTWHELGDAIRAKRIEAGGCISNFLYDPKRYCTTCLRGPNYLGQLMYLDSNGDFDWVDPQQKHAMERQMAQMRAHLRVAESGDEGSDAAVGSATSSLGPGDSPALLGGEPGPAAAACPLPLAAATGAATPGQEEPFAAIACEERTFSAHRKPDDPIVVVFSAPLLPVQPWSKLVEVRPDGAELTFEVRGEKLLVYGLLRGDQATKVGLSRGIAALDGRTTASRERLELHTAPEAECLEVYSSAAGGAAILEAALGPFCPLLAKEGDDEVVEVAALAGPVRDDVGPLASEFPWREVYRGRLRETIRQPWRVAVDLRPLLPHPSGGAVALRTHASSLVKSLLVTDSGLAIVRAGGRARIWLRSLATGATIPRAALAHSPDPEPHLTSAPWVVDWPRDAEAIEVPTPEATVVVGNWQLDGRRWDVPQPIAARLYLASPVAVAGGTLELFGWTGGAPADAGPTIQVAWQLHCGGKTLAQGQGDLGPDGRGGSLRIALPPSLGRNALWLRASWLGVESAWTWDLRRAERAPWTWKLDSAATKLTILPAPLGQNGRPAASVACAQWSVRPLPQPLPVGAGRRELPDPLKTADLSVGRRSMGEWVVSPRPESHPADVVRLPLDSDGSAELGPGRGHAVVGVTVGKAKLGVRIWRQQAEVQLELRAKAVCVAPSQPWQLAVQADGDAPALGQVRLYRIQASDPLAWDAEAAPRRIDTDPAAVEVGQWPVTGQPRPATDQSFMQALTLTAPQPGRYRAVLEAADGEVLRQIDLFAWAPGVDLGPCWDVDRPDVQPLAVDLHSKTVELLIHSPLQSGLAVAGWDDARLEDLGEFPVQGHAAHVRLPLPTHPEQMPMLHVIVQAPRLAPPDLRPDDPGRPRCATASVDLFGKWHLGQPTGELKVVRRGAQLHVAIACGGPVPANAELWVWAVPEALVQAELPEQPGDGGLGLEWYDNRKQIPPRQGCAEVAVAGVRPAFWSRHAERWQIPPGQRPQGKPDGWVFGHSTDSAARYDAAGEVHMHLSLKAPPDLGPVAWPADLPDQPWPVRHWRLEQGLAEGDLQCPPGPAMGWRVRAVVRTAGAPLTLAAAPLL